LSERDAPTIAANLKTLLDNTAERDRYAEQGYQWIKNTLALDKSLDRYAVLYHELADNRP